MSGFADLVTKACSQEGGRLGDAPIKGETEGVTWNFKWDNINDFTGAPVDLTSATIVCKIIDDVDGADVLVLTTTGGLGTLTVSANSSDTAGLAVGATSKQARRCLWFCTVTSGSNKVQFWGPVGSPFLIYPA